VVAQPILLLPLSQLAAHKPTRCCRYTKPAERCSIETTGRQSPPIHALQAEVVCLPSIRANEESATASLPSSPFSRRPTNGAPLFSHRNMRHSSPDLVCHAHRALFAPYYHHASMHPRPRIDRQVQSGFCTRPQRKTSYRNQT
jgi:hypothetical protein